MKYQVSEASRRLWLASVVGVGAVAVAMWFLQTNNDAAAAPLKATTVLVAKSYIAAQSALDVSCCYEKRVPDIYAPPHPIQKKDFGAGSNASRLRARGEILKGEILTIARVADGVASGASWNIGENEAAVTLHLTPEAAMAGILAPGDIVNVLVTFDKRLCVQVPNASVLAVGKRTGRSNDEVPGSSDDTLVTLALDAKDAMRAVLAAQKQTVSLALVSPLSTPAMPACIGLGDL